MNKPCILDFSKTKCWMLNLLPFDGKEKENEKLVFSFQMKCRDDKVFGIGWYLKDHRYGEMSEDTIKSYRDDYEHTYCPIESAHNKAIQGFMQIKPGHYVIIRLRDAHYYIGKVSSNPRFDDDGKYQYLSWYGVVDEWAEFENDEQLPSEIVSRFSRSIQPTVEQIVSGRQRVLLIQAYERRIGICNSDFLKIKLTNKNYCRSMNYRDLEDLVCHYITTLNPEYMLLPSSCKVNHPKYEFTFVVPGGKPITCQVKNQADLPNVEIYKNDTSFEKIYLFSGLITDEQIYEYRKAYANYSHLCFISPSELYIALSEFDYLLEKTSAYYEICDNVYDVESLLNKNGWIEVESFRGIKPKRYIWDNERNVYLNTTRTVYYSEELHAIVYTGNGNPDDRRLIAEIEDLF